MKVIVLGLGSMGATSCWRLAQRGVRVLGFDRFTPPHDHGSHHGESRMIRQAYYEHPDYVPLLLRSYELWRELEQSTAESLLQETGGLYLGPRDCPIVAGSLRSAQNHGLAHELLGQEELRTRFPQFRVPEHVVGFFEGKAGFLRSEACLAAALKQARRHGADLRCDEEVKGWHGDAAGVTVETKHGVHHADRLVITAGAWAGPLLHDLGIPLTVTRQVLAWFRPRRNAPQFSPGSFPCWYVESNPPFGHYGFPSLARSGTVKLALHQAGEPIDPDTLSQQPPTPEEGEELRAFLAEHIPDAAGDLLASRSCLYTNSPDQHFVVGCHPRDHRVSFATGFSGHGFKFASVMGEILADLATTGESALPIGFLSPNRFD